MIATQTAPAAPRTLSGREVARICAARFGELCQPVYCPAGLPAWGCAPGDWIVLNEAGRPVGSIASDGAVYDEAE